MKKRIMIGIIETINEIFNRINLHTDFIIFFYFITFQF